MQNSTQNTMQNKHASANKRPLRVLVVDDSNLMRSHICGALVEHDMLTDTAADGKECLAKIPKFKPDVITLDINMPVMDGLECLKEIMDKHPLPVVMVSSLTQKHAHETLQALELGAVDYVAKPNGPVSLTLSRSKYMLVSKVINAGKLTLSPKSRVAKKPASLSKQAPEPISTKAIGYRGIGSKGTAPKTIAHQNRPMQSREAIRHQSANFALSPKAPQLIIIGVSTGGPVCLQTIISELPKDFSSPIVVAQHMPARFTKVFAERLNKLSALKVSELNRREALLAGHVYVAQGDANVLISKRQGQLYGEPDTCESHHIWKPSITKLVESAMTQVDACALCCVQLTGMGNDGAQAMAQAHKRGAYTIAESEETAVVYGMPKELVKFGGASKVLANYEIAKALIATQ